MYDETLNNAQRLLSRLDELEAELSRVHHALEHHERLATLGTIAGLIAHEFNNILTPVMSYAQMALAAPDDHELATKALHKAAEGSDRASQIAGAILGFVRDDGSDIWAKARATRDGHHPASTPVAPTPPLTPAADVLSAVQDAVACMGRDLARDLIDLRVVGEPGLCAGLKPLALQHILLNLILNARTAMLPLGGILTVEARRCTTPPPAPEAAACSRDAGSTWNISGRRPPPTSVSAALARETSGPHTDSGGDGNGDGNGEDRAIPFTAAPAPPLSWAVVRITDTGRGMRPDALARVFEPFYTSAGRDGAPPRRGTGLGMTMCKRLADEVGGYLIIESAVGQGTTVTLALPEAAPAGALRRSA